ncbi:hypothetical protein J8J40_27490, partial [Mycobacterium tuberculosis]|nr:hypothetical protein [Mycobacterium tuberculosis]
PHALYTLLIVGRVRCVSATAIRVPPGSPTKAAPAAFVRAAFDGMAALLGPLHDESYVLVHATDGDAYGFGGRTQNARWATAHPG